MSNTEKKILVYENWSSESPLRLGTMFVTNQRGNETISFEYDESYLRRNPILTLDPDLSFYTGRQYATFDKPNFGIFSDSAPDRWGRMLMDRRERLQAKKECRKPRKLADTDYLLGVYDESRMGALRFALDEAGPFLSADSDHSIPPWTTLRTLEEASRQFEKDESNLNEDLLRQLLKPGSSLGGARPKATVRNADGSLWIAKFPSKHDDYNTGAWEKVVHDLARMCGIQVPESRASVFSNDGSTFLVKRFDRCGSKRIHFSSAMTMLGKTDGPSSRDGTSYLELADFLHRNGSQPKKDLAQLWARIVFNMAVSNTDDHLRNHGFLLEETGWRLSPAYDLNPVPYGDELALNVTMDDCSIDIELALETASYYGLDANEAENVADQICLTVRENWEKLAARNGLSHSAIEYMRPAFTASISR